MLGNPCVPARSEQQGEWEGLGSLLNPTLDTPDPGAVSSGKFSSAVPSVQTEGEANGQAGPLFPTPTGVTFGLFLP